MDDLNEAYQPLRGLGHLGERLSLPEPEPAVGSSAWMARNSSAAIRQFCSHGLSDNTYITAVDVVTGRKATVKLYHYECRDHGRYGSFSLLVEPR